MDRLVDCLIKEVDIQQKYLNEPVETIYFGGGTPSLLNVSQLNSLLSKLKQTFNVIDSAEITLEANPDDLDVLKLTALKQSGINRLSIGVQSFDAEVLQFLNRAHNESQAKDSIELSKKAGFKKYKY